MSLFYTPQRLHFSRFLVILVASLFLLALLISPQIAHASTEQHANNRYQPDMLWFYGMARSWGVLGYDLQGDPIDTAEKSTDTLFSRTEQVEQALGVTNTHIHADLIFYSPKWITDEMVYNPLVEETIHQMFDRADQTGQYLTISINITAPRGWRGADMVQAIDTIWSGQSGYLSSETIQKYADRLSLSIDCEGAIINGVRPKIIHGQDLPDLYAAYSQYQPNSKMYVYDFRIFNDVATLSPNVIPIFNGIGYTEKSLTDNYLNVQEQWGNRPLGVMAFIFEQLGESERSKAFGVGRVDQVISWIQTAGLTPPILGFQ